METDTREFELMRAQGEMCKGMAIESRKQSRRGNEKRALAVSVAHPNRDDGKKK